MSFEKRTDKDNWLLTRLSYENLDAFKGMSLEDIKLEVEKHPEFSKLSSICDALIANGYGDVVVKDVLNNNDKSKENCSGYYGIALEDKNNNCAIISRGTEFENIPAKFDKSDLVGTAKYYINELLSQEDMHDNVQALFVGNSVQTQEAKDFFEKNKSITGKNYLFRHSKGGAISTEIYLDNYEEVEEVNIINATPPNYTLLSNEDKAKLADCKLKPIIYQDDPISYLGRSYASLNTGTRFVETTCDDFDIVNAHFISKAAFDGDNYKDSILSPIQYHVYPHISNYIIDLQKQYNKDETIFETDYSYLKDNIPADENEKRRFKESLRRNF